MIIQYASDLHLEFPGNRRFMKKNPIKPEGDVLLLAGDIVPFVLVDNKLQDFFSYVSRNFKKTYWIPGNHEYYYFDAADKSGLLNENIRDNVHLVNNLTVENTDVRFIFSTLWSKISPAYQWQVERGMTDFQVIKYKGKRFSADVFNQLHETSLDFITSELSRNHSGKTVVVTHHVPTFMNYPSRFKDSDLNEAFAAEILYLIEKAGPDYWIYGHHHSNIPDFEIGPTKMLTNQLGYVDYDEHLLFNRKETIKI